MRNIGKKEKQDQQTFQFILFKKRVTKNIKYITNQNIPSGV